MWTNGRSQTSRLNSPVARLAAEKALAVEAEPDALVLGADTVVVVDGQFLGKPASEAEAAGMLRRLSGRSHDVLTGVYVKAGISGVGEVDRTVVRFLPLSAAEIDWYVASGEPDGKAGAYAIQGLASRFVDRIEGSYSNVVGLPVATVCRLVRRLGFQLDGTAEFR